MMELIRLRSKYIVWMIVLVFGAFLFAMAFFNGDDEEDAVKEKSVEVTKTEQTS